MKKLLTIMLMLCLTTQVKSQCDLLQTSVDKFTGDKITLTPGYVNNTKGLKEFLLPYTFGKKITPNADTTYSCFLSLIHKGVNYGHGLIILFENGSKITKSEWELSRSYKITSEERYLFSSFLITDVRVLSVGDFAIKTAEAQAIKTYINCLIN